MSNNWWYFGGRNDYPDSQVFFYDPTVLNEAPIAGMTKLDMSALVNQGMIQIQGKHFGVISQKRVILTLPDPSRIVISVREKWWYVSDVQEDHDEYDEDNRVNEDQMEEEYRDHKPTCNPLKMPTQEGGRSSYFT